MKTVLKIAAGMGAAGLILILVISLISGKTSLTSEDLGINVNQLENGIGISVGRSLDGNGARVIRTGIIRTMRMKFIISMAWLTATGIFKSMKKRFPISQELMWKVIWAM